MKLANNIFVLFILIFFSLQCLAQNNAEKELRLLFKELKEAKKKMSVSTVNTIPFHQLSQVKCNSFLEVINGSKCYSYFCSKQMQVMEQIYRVYSNEDVNKVYALYGNSTQQRLLDFTVNQCEGDHYVKMDSAIQALYNSYLKWYDLVKQYGLSYVRIHKIPPTEYCDFSWKTICGYVYAKTEFRKIKKKTHYYNIVPVVTYLQIKQIFFSLLESDFQSLLYVKDQQLQNWFPEETPQQIITQIGILTLLNMDGFTPNVLRFKLVSLSNKNFDITSITEELSKTENTLELQTLLNNNNIVVVLR